MENSHLQRIKQQQENIFLVTGTDNNRAVWHYLRCEPAKAPLLRKHTQEGKRLSLNDYGDILQSGFGKEPPIMVQYHFSGEKEDQ